MWPEFRKIQIVWENKNINIIIKLLKAKNTQIQKKMYQLKENNNSNNCRFLIRNPRGQKEVKQYF